MVGRVIGIILALLLVAYVIYEMNQTQSQMEYDPNVKALKEAVMDRLPQESPVPDAPPAPVHPQGNQAPAQP